MVTVAAEPPGLPGPPPAPVEDVLTRFLDMGGVLKVNKTNKQQTNKQININKLGIPRRRRWRRRGEAHPRGGLVQEFSEMDRVIQWGSDIVTTTGQKIVTR